MPCLAESLSLFSPGDSLERLIEMVARALLFLPVSLPFLVEIASRVYLEKFPRSFRASNKLPILTFEKLTLSQKNNIHLSPTSLSFEMPRRTLRGSHRRHGAATRERLPLHRNITTTQPTCSRGPQGLSIRRRPRNPSRRILQGHPGGFQSRSHRGT